MHPGFTLTGRVDKKPSREIGCDTIGQHLVEISVLETCRIEAFVLCVPDKNASVALPPGQVWLELYSFGNIQSQPAASAILREVPLVDTELLAKCCDDEVLEDLIHIDQQGASGDSAGSQLNRCRPEHESGKLDSRSVAGGQAVVGELRQMVGIEGNQTDGAEPRP